MVLIILFSYLYKEENMTAEEKIKIKNVLLERIDPDPTSLKLKDEIILENYRTKGNVYIDGFLDLLDDIENKCGFKIDEDILIQFLSINTGGTGGTPDAAKKDNERRLKLRSELKSSIFSPIKRVADWTKYGVVVQILDLVLVGIGVSLFSLFLPHKWDKEASKEPTKIIIEQPIVIDQSKENPPKAFTEKITIESI